MIADISRGRMRLRVNGQDRVTFLHGQCTNDIQRLRPSQSCYAAFLNAKGKMRGEGHVICLPDAFLLEASEGLQAPLEKFVITEDVTVEDVSATMGEWLVIGGAEGTAAGTALRAVRDAEEAAARPAVAPYRGPEVALPAGAVTFGHPLGLGVISDKTMTVTLDAAALEVLRIEAGVPLWGVDMDENTIPIEAGLEKRAINYDKGCYIGQETIARIKTYGHVNRQLVQLSVNRDQLPVRGAKILAGEREIGHVTSAAHSARFGKPLALGYVRREAAQVGMKLKIGEQAAEVLKLCAG
jgi:folate-binding protein YgfZ